MENETIETTKESEAPATAAVNTMIPAGALIDPKLPPYVGD